MPSTCTFARPTAKRLAGAASLAALCVASWVACAGSRAVDPAERDRRDVGDFVGMDAVDPAADAESSEDTPPDTEPLDTEASDGAPPDAEPDLGAADAGPRDVEPADAEPVESDAEGAGPRDADPEDGDPEDSDPEDSDPPDLDAAEAEPLDGDPDGAPDAGDSLDATEDPVSDADPTCPDGDGDGVCDADDRCPGRDDALGCLPERGTYAWTRLEVAAAEAAQAVAFSPDGRYALVLDRIDGVRVFDTARGDVRRVLLESGVQDPVYWQDLAFSPDGRVALIVGTRIGGTTEGVAWVFDDAAYRAADASPALAFRRLTGVASRPYFEAVTFAGPRHSDGQPILLSRSARAPYSMWLDAIDVDAGTSTVLVASATTAGCQDIAYIENEFGNAGYLVVCGVNGYDGRYWTEVGGAFTLRSDLGENRVGNASRIVARPQGDYALVIQNASDRIHRFEAGQMNAASEAPWFQTRRLWSGAFDASGQRALIVGWHQVVSGEEIGVALEYRDGGYSCPAPLSEACEIAEVSISGFGVAPWNAPPSTQLSEIAWRPGCDGGIAVGGVSALSVEYGFFATFQLEGGRPCW